MKLKRVWLLSGIPGSGKSTWVKNQISKKGGYWASRDAVRFSMIKEDEPYFNKEVEVFETWISQIYEALTNPLIKDVYIDATHINEKSREKVLKRLPKDNIENIINVVFTTPLEICLERNETRKGREYVPSSVIKRMYYQFEYPKKNSTIYINKNGEENKDK